jgi:antitoxin ParD1/3/4
VNINFSGVDKNFMNLMVAGGYYANSTELIRDAVRRLREQNKEQYQLLLALAKGNKDLENSQLVSPEDIGAFVNQCEKEARKMLAEGATPDPDVTP